MSIRSTKSVFGSPRAAVSPSCRRSASPVFGSPRAAVSPSRHSVVRRSSSPSRKQSTKRLSIEKLSEKNNNFRRVVYTDENAQVVLMSLEPGVEIGEETHMNTSQFFRIESGIARVRSNGKNMVLKDGDAVVVPPGTTHNVWCSKRSKTPVKLYTIYSGEILHKNNEIERKNKMIVQKKTKPLRRK